MKFKYIIDVFPWTRDNNPPLPMMNPEFIGKKNEHAKRYEFEIEVPDFDREIDGRLRAPTLREIV